MWPNDDQMDLAREAARSYGRILPRLEKRLAPAVLKEKNWREFTQRLERHFPALFSLYVSLYGGRYDCIYHLEDLLAGLAESWTQRARSLKDLDRRREADPHWFQSSRMVGAVCYVDLFAGNLQGIRARIPYFKELGVTYLHLMPLFLRPAGENDGGYAVSSYRDVQPELGSMDELVELAEDLRREGISLALDLVFNHTSNEHAWAEEARAGSAEAAELYRIFPDRTMPDQYERSLREIFPDEHPGAFTFDQRLRKWVWTTFHAYQWDLNYANPEVFNRMAEEMLFLANAGVEVIRLDAVAFIWKQMGTTCENLPQTHQIIRAFNAVARIAAPALLFKSEAIVHPDQVVEYIAPEECQLSYNPLLMALLWESLATRSVALLQRSMANRFRIHPGTAWVNYVRVHDDIGWTFADEDGWQLGINGYDHRRFLNAFYTGQFAGSFARGLPFQFNPATGDARISGTCASLAGLEKALDSETELEVELAIRRILLLHSVILSAGGIPLIYLGDEVATLNDYSYRENPALAGDSRWVHRPRADETRAAQRLDPQTIPGRLYTALRALIHIRAAHPVFSGCETEFPSSGNLHILAYARYHAGERLLALASFTEQPQSLPAGRLQELGAVGSLRDLVSGAHIDSSGALEFAPYQFYWLV